MFEQALLSRGPAAKRVWTTCLGITGQALVVTAMILTPLIWPEVLPRANAYVGLIGPIAPPPPPPPAGAPAVRPRSTPAGAQPRMAWRPMVQPARVPSVLLPADDAVEIGPIGAALVGSADTIGDPHGVPGGLGILPNRIAPPPPPQPKPSAVAPQSTAARPIVIKTSQLDIARILRRVEPVYPEMARRMRVSGTVELRGIIGTDGRIRELKVLSGHPLLVKAAVDAVSQWIYEPTRLSGEPVEVDAPIIVTFRMN